MEDIIDVLLANLRVLSHDLLIATIIYQRSGVHDPSGQLFELYIRKYLRQLKYPVLNRPGEPYFEYCGDMNFEFDAVTLLLPHTIVDARAYVEAKDYRHRFGSLDQLLYFNQKVDFLQATKAYEWLAKKQIGLLSRILITPSRITRNIKSFGLTYGICIVSPFFYPVFSLIDFVQPQKRKTLYERWFFFARYLLAAGNFNLTYKCSLSPPQFRELFIKSPVDLFTGEKLMDMYFSLARYLDKDRINFMLNQRAAKVATHLLSPFIQKI